MDVGYVSALAALAGSAIGGLTSLATSWLTQQRQFRSQQVAHDLSRREQLYTDFVDEAAKLYADAYEHAKSDIATLVRLYALIGRIRMLSSPQIIDSADKVARLIIETYLAPNKTFRDVVEILDREELNPVREFSEACREELQRLRA